MPTAKPSRKTINQRPSKAPQAPAHLQGQRTGRGNPVVLLHGLGLSARMWDPFATRLAAEGFEAIAVDLRGHGNSPVVDAEVDLEVLSADVADFLDREGIARPHLVGFSMGGMIAMRLAAARRSLRSLTLVSTSAQADPAREQFEATAEYLREHGLDETGDLYLQMLCSPGYPRAHPALAERYRPIILGNDRVGVYRATLAVVQRPDILTRLAAIEAPTLIISGTADVPTPPVCAAAMAKAIPGASLTSIDGAGHLLTEEQPELFAKAVFDHLRVHHG
jgi:3-oxoadipate enol-lactonase